MKLKVTVLGTKTNESPDLLDATLPVAAPPVTDGKPFVREIAAPCDVRVVLEGMRIDQERFAMRWRYTEDQNPTLVLPGATVELKGKAPPTLEAKLVKMGWTLTRLPT